MNRTLVILIALTYAPSVTAFEEPASWQYVRDVVPLTAKYCLPCHQGEDAQGGISVRQFRTAADFPAKRDSAEKILKAIQSGLMPPDDEPQPTSLERKRWANWIENELYDLDCDEAPDPGRVTIRRLNRVEYNNTIRDLLALPSSFSPADAFPSDDVGEGFDNIGDVLSLPPLLLEKYMDAAELIADKAIVVRNAETAQRQVREGTKITSKGGVKFRRGVFAFISQGVVRASFAFPRSGRYLIRVSAAGDQAGDEKAKMKWTLGGRELGVIDVPNNRDNPRVFEREIQARKGRQILEVEFVNDYYVRNKADRNLYVERLEAVGPMDVKMSEMPESHRRVVSRTPRSNSEWLLAATDNLRPIMQRAFRRPLNDAEIAPHAKLVLLAQERGETFEQGMRVALSSVLVSPQFLFRIERDPNPEDASSSHAVSDYELASRLSYFLWSSMPDDTLFKLAKQEKLHEEDVLVEQVKRMLKDQKSRAMIENFGGQWLNLRNLEETTRDPEKFRVFDASLRRAMIQETILFMEEIMRKDRPIVELLTGQYSYVNGDLAELYGIEGVSGSRFRRVTFDNLPRFGVLTQASILTITSTPTRTSPVMRGKWIMQNILGEPPPDPPADVPDLEETKKASPSATLREQLEIHRKDATCAVCHRKMDQLGFGFENFDAIGRWRVRDGGVSIDASGVLPGGAKFSGPEQLVQVLMNSKDNFTRVMAEKMLTYALGRGLKYYDRCAVDDISSATIKGEYRFSELVAAIVLSDPFRKRRGDGGKP